MIENAKVDSGGGGGVILTKEQIYIQSIYVLDSNNFDSSMILI